MSHLQKAAGFSAIFEALIYVVAFVYFGAFGHTRPKGLYQKNGLFSGKSVRIFNDLFSDVCGVWNFSSRSCCWLI